MQRIIKTKDLGVLIGITIAIGLLAYVFTRQDFVLYLMITAIFGEALIYEKDRKKNFWQYIVSFVLLLIFLYLLLNFI